MKRVGVLGTLVWDRIWHPAASAAEPREQWGGIAYSLSAFSACCPPGWEVVPILKVGSDLAAEAGTFLESLPRVMHRDSVRVVSEPNNRVELRYVDEANRTERLTGDVPRWSWEELKPLLYDLDALYVNFISGFELELPDARALRAGFRGPIYADLHSLFLGPPTGGPREPRPLPGGETWLGCFDVVQLNEDELRLLAGGVTNLQQAAVEAVRAGPRLLLATLGAEGALVASRDGSGDPTRTLRVPTSHVRTGDPTGCGDVWGSACFAGLLEGLGVEEAVSRAHRLAARKVSSAGTAHLCSELRAALEEATPS
jgi:hypothetical protein